MAVNLHYDKVTRVEIGYNLANHVNITNVVSFAERVVSPDGDMLDPMLMINEADLRPEGVHHNQKYWEMELVLDTNWLPDNGAPTEYWAYYQDVQSDALVQAAIVDGGDNNYIEWFKVFIRQSDGVTTTTLTYADGTADSKKLWCVGETTEINNERGTRHQPTTYRFICLGNRVRT